MKTRSRMVDGTGMIVGDVKETAAKKAITKSKNRAIKSRRWTMKSQIIKGNYTVCSFSQAIRYNISPVPIPTLVL